MPLTGKTHTRPALAQLSRGTGTSRCWSWARPQLQVTFAGSFPFFVQWLPPRLKEAKPRALPQGCSRAREERTSRGPHVALGGRQGGGSFLLGASGPPWPQEQAPAVTLARGDISRGGAAGRCQSIAGLQTTLAVPWRKASKGTQTKTGKKMGG